MEAFTLVLDPGYKPIDRIPWQRAFTLIFLGKVDVVEEYEDHEVKSVSFSYKVPSIVRWLGRIRKTRRAIKFSRENVYARDRGKCQYCAMKITRATFTYDHVLPKSRGGLTEWTNVVCACMDCNQKKRDRTPQEAGMKLQNLPEKPKKLPETATFTLTWRKGDPDVWRQWLTSIAYWNSELDE